MSARKRRTQDPPSQPQPTFAPPVQQQQAQGGLTLPQVIALIDRRLTNLELPKTEVDSGDSNLNQDDIEEFETRFDILAEEISNLKEIILSLQSYTMNVNKILLEERKDFSIETKL
jgi:hypothetical protein